MLSPRPFSTNIPVLIFIVLDPRLKTVNDDDDDDDDDDEVMLNVLRCQLTY